MDFDEDPIVDSNEEENFFPISSTTKKRKRETTNRVKKQLLLIDIEVERECISETSASSILVPNSCSPCTPSFALSISPEQRIKLISSWFGDLVPGHVVKETMERIDKVVFQMGYCFIYYGYVQPDTSSRDDITLRLMIFCDRIISSLGGTISIHKIDSLIVVAGLILIKMWSDTNIHHKYIEQQVELETRDIEYLEMMYLKTIKFACHITPLQILDFRKKLGPI